MSIVYFRQNERERTKDQLEADKKVSYAGIPSAVLYCHVCFKHMWDSEVKITVFKYLNRKLLIL